MRAPPKDRIQGSAEVLLFFLVPATDQTVDVNSSSCTLSNVIPAVPCFVNHTRSNHHFDRSHKLFRILYTGVGKRFCRFFIHRPALLQGFDNHLSPQCKCGRCKYCHVCLLFSLRFGHVPDPAYKLRDYLTRKKHSPAGSRGFLFPLRTAK